MEICIAWSESMTGREDCVDSTQNIISFCTGYSGLELGIKRAGVDVRTVCYLEIEVYVQAVLVKAMEEGRLCSAPIWSNVKSFDARPFRGIVDGITGGFPCQPFSSAGKRKGQEDPRHLWPSIANSIRLCRPGWVFLENVPGLVTLGLRDVLQDLGQMGYRTTWNIFSAEEVGAPHQRKRVFILAKLPNASCEGLQGDELPTQYRKEDTGREASRNGSTAKLCNDAELGNPSSLRPHRGSENCEGEQSEVLGERLESDELGNTKHDGSSTTQDGRSTCEEQEEGRLQELERGCKQSQDELAHPTSRQPRQSQARNGGQDTSGGSEEELADSERCGSAESMQLDTDLSAKPSGCDREEGQELGQTQWPARPGEEQYEWEEPRVVGNTEVKGCRGMVHEQGESGDKKGRHTNGSSNGKENLGQAKPQLGGTVDGTQHRVDRLRLLGNGVVPQTAELAWKTLWKEMNK